MSDTSHCSECGAQLPTGATEGLCPKCLMGAVLGGDSADEKPSGAAFAATTPMTGGFVPPEAASLAAHFPQLEILELIGHGGMGAVYKARQTKLDRLVALKIIRPESAEDPTFAERFNREARTLARLSHPHIVAVHDFGEVTMASGGRESPDGAPGALYFFIMEYVDGANLRQLIESRQLAPAQALGIVPQICDALQYAHDEGVIHRDIKPENILLDRRGRVKIADFGLAKLTASGERESPDFTLTATHQVMGTPRYMAPEQMEGSHTVDHRADIYSLGVVFYEMLTGEVPMGSFAPPSQKAEIDARLDQVVLRALAREPERRYQQAGEIRTEIESILFASIPVGEVGVSQPSGPYAPTVLTPPPGPSTVLEQGVAAAVARFRGIGARQPQAPSGDALRFSRKAIVGAIWAALFFLVLGTFVPLAFAALVHQEREAVQRQRSFEILRQSGIAPRNYNDEVDKPGDGLDDEEPVASNGNAASVDQHQPVVEARPTMLFLLLIGLVALPAALAPFGTTILGMMAISDIRHSNGKVTGLGLAFFDAVLFPSLLLFGLIFSFALWEVGATGINHPDFNGSVMASAMLWLVVAGVVLTWLWRKVSRPYDAAPMSHSSQQATAKPQLDVSPSTGGRDWVTLSRDDVEHDRLPNVCMVCGTPTGERVNKTFEHQPDWAGVLTIIGMIAGFIPGLIIAALTSTQVRVSCPVCPQHRNHWSRLVWVASTGWLLAFLLAGAGYLIGWALYREHGGPQAAGVAIGAVVGLIVYLVPVIYLASTRVGVETITKDEIRFQGVAAAFSRAAAGEDIATRTPRRKHGRPSPGRRWRLPGALLVANIVAVGIAAVGVLLVVSWDSFDESPSATLAEPPPRSIAVLRFVSVGDPSGGPLHFFPHAQLTEEFCDDLTDAVRRRITETTNGPLLVRPVGNKYSYVVTDDESLRAGRTLNVRTVVKATLHCVDADGNLVPQDLDGTSHVVLTVKMLDVSSGALLWVAELKEPTPTTDEERQAYRQKIAEAVAEQVERKLTDDRA